MCKNGCNSVRLLPWLLLLSVLGKTEAQPQVADASTVGNDSRPVLRVGSISVRKILNLLINEKANNNKQICTKNEKEYSS
jgi:hypothetical protein